MSESILWNEMGNLHMRLGSYEDAVSAYGKAIELSPEFSLAYSNLGHALFSKGDYDGAIPLLQKSIDLSNSVQEQATTWKRMGDAYQKMGIYEKAMSAYKTGDELDALAGVGLINPFADLPQDVKPDPIILDAISDENPPTEVDLPVTDFVIKNVEESDVDTLEEKDSGVEDITDLALPTVPPFVPAIEINDEEFQIPEPVQNDPAEKSDPVAELETLKFDQEEDVIPMVDPDTDDSDSSREEEYVEFNQWLQSVDKQPASVQSDFPSTRWDDQPTMPARTRSNYVNPITNPVQNTGFVMLDTNSREPGIPLFSDQEIWEPQDVSVSPKGTTDIIQSHAVQSVEVVETVTTARSMELFKSWKISEQPEHDPNIWKAMIEALEKSQNKSYPEAVKVETVLPSEMTEPVRKPAVSRELLDNIDNYKKITSMAPLNDKAWDTLGKLLKDAGEFDAAVDAFQHAICICPNKDLYQYHLGLVFAAQKKHDLAVDAFKRVVEINPAYTLAHCALAGSYRRLGLETEANAHIKVALPKLDAETEYNRACFEAICGNTDQALELLKLALDMKQTSPEWVRGDPDLDFIRDDPRFHALVGK